MPFAIAETNDIDFDRDVRPILAEHCYACHGHDANRREAGLRLDQEHGATATLESGNIAVVPNKLAQSALVRRITSDDEDVRMPPRESNKPLSEKEIGILKKWIVEGASWKQHWAFVPPKRPIIPKVINHNWCSTSVDSFVLAELEKRKLTAPLPASRRTFIRRVYFDLIGLPPTPDEVEEFVTEASPDAFERLVDRLLASPRYGERWGRHWLDVVRYGDSNGGDENHAYPLAYRYRNYVVDSFNRDDGFDRFTQMQIAGDLIPSGDVTATGFLAMGMKILAEQDPVKKRADMVDEQIDTFGKTFLGLTFACARCHDHKFDPIPTTDYYALAGVFHSSEQVDATLESPQQKMLLASLKTKIDAVDQKLAKLQKTISQRAEGSGVMSWEAEKFQRGNVVVVNDGYGEGIGIISDPGGQKNFAEYDLEVPKEGKYLLQLRYAAKSSRPGQLIVNGKTVNDEILKEVTGGWFPPQQRWHTEGFYLLKRGKNVLRVQSEPNMSHIDKIRLIPSTDKGLGEDRGLGKDSSLGKLIAESEGLIKQRAKLVQQTPQPTKVMAVKEGTSRNVRVHLRGSHLSLGDEVERGHPTSVDGSNIRNGSNVTIPDNQSGRRQLANWLTDSKSNASGMLSRVIVNRVWHWHFGRGLVGTPNNFGIKGGRPTHPELLDHLAIRLQDQNWSLKSLHREIVLSSTYRMRSDIDDNTAAAVDPDNRWYWKAPRRRLQAELIRDAMLFHAGQIDLAIGEAPLAVKTQDLSPVDLKNNRNFYHQSHRRSVYLPVVRTNASRFLKLFDFPDAATSVGRRNETTVATQGLLLMNSPFVLQRADEFAARLLKDSDNDDSRIQQAYLQLFSRPPNAKEAAAAKWFLAAMSKSNDDVRTAWAAYCQTMFLSGEFIYVD